MFTQCSKCETIFRVSAAALRAAGGQVRCGRCGEVFNALTRLAEDAGGFTKGESPLFLETRAEEILAAGTDEDLEAPDASAPHASAPDASEMAAAPAVAVAATPAAPAAPVVPAPAEGTELVHLRFIGVVDDDLAAETSLEFTLPPDHLDRIFVPAPESLAEANLPPHPETMPLAPVPDEPTLVTSLVARREDAPFAIWLTVAIALGILMLAQFAMSNRDWLASHVPLLGSVASPAAALSFYQLRQWGVTGDPGAKGTLRVRASIMNTAARMQPYPLLRVTLVNRFGTRVGAREFEPAEYLGRPVARMLAPGERLDATLDILDPGRDAEGFEIDVCLRGPDKKAVCVSDLPAQAHADG